MNYVNVPPFELKLQPIEYIIDSWILFCEITLYISAELVFVREICVACKNQINCCLDLVLMFGIDGVERS